MTLAFSACTDGVRSILMSTVVAPFALFALAQVVYLMIIVNFHLPILAGALAPLVRILGGGGAVHYPGLYLALPAIFNKSLLFIAGTLGAYLWGVGIIAAANRFEGPAGSPWRDAFVRLPHLFLAQLPVVLIVLLSFVLQATLETRADVGGNAKRLLIYGPIPFGILVESLFLFAPMAVMLEGRNALSAIARSISIWRSNAVTALLIVGLTTLPHLPTYWLHQRTYWVMTTFSPETVLLVLGGDVLLHILTNVVLIVAATLVLLDVGRRDAS